jgi:hypothetical protein
MAFETDNRRLAELLDVNNNLVIAEEIEKEFPGLMETIGDAMRLLSNQQVPPGKVIIRHNHIVVQGRPPFSHIEAKVYSTA